MSEHRIFFKRVALIGVVKIITSFRGLILLPLLTKTVGVAHYGVWSQILVTVGLLMPLLTLNLATPMARFLSAERDTKKAGEGIFAIVFAVFFTSICVGLVLFLFSDSFAAVLLQDPSFSFFIKLASIILVLEALSQISMDSFRIFGQIKKYSGLTMAQTVLEIGLISALVFLGFGLFGSLLALIIARAIVLLFSLYVIISHTGLVRPDFSVLKPYLAFALPLLPLGLFDILINSSDRYIVGFFKGAAAVGIYSATYNVGFLAVVFIFPIAYILSPTVFKLFDEGKIENVKMYLSYSLKYFLLFSIPAVFGLTMLAKAMLATLATSEFVVWNSMLVVLMVSLGAVFYGVQAIYAQVIMLEKKQNFFVAIFGIGVAVNVILNIIFIPYFGVIAAAASTLVAYVIVAAGVYMRSRRYLQFGADIPFIVKSILASCFMAVAVYFVNPSGAAGILLAACGGAALYFILLFFLKAFTKQEMAFFLSALKLRNFSEKY